MTDTRRLRRETVSTSTPAAANTPAAETPSQPRRDTPLSKTTERHLDHIHHLQEHQHDNQSELDALRAQERSRPIAPA